MPISTVIVKAEEVNSKEPAITRTLVTGHFLDGKVWREYGYTVTIGDREFIRRFEAAGRRK